MMNTNIERVYAWQGQKQQILILFGEQKQLKEKRNEITPLSHDGMIKTKLYFYSYFYLCSVFFFFINYENGIILNIFVPI